MLKKEEEKDPLQIELEQARQAYKFALESSPEAKAKRRVIEVENRIRNRAILKAEGDQEKAKREVEKVNRENKKFIQGLKDADEGMKAAQARRYPLLVKIEKAVKWHREATQKLEELRAGIIEEQKPSKNVPLKWEEKEIKKSKKIRLPEFEEK